MHCDTTVFPISWRHVCVEFRQRRRQRRRKRQAQTPPDANMPCFGLPRWLTWKSRTLETGKSMKKENISWERHPAERATRTVTRDNTSPSGVTPLSQESTLHCVATPNHHVIVAPTGVQQLLQDASSGLPPCSEVQLPSQTVPPVTMRSVLNCHSSLHHNQRLSKTTRGCPAHLRCSNAEPSH